MNETVGQPASASRVVNFPTPQNRESLTIRQLADAYMAQYAGRDNARPARVLWWCDGIGDVRVVDLDADLIADHLDHFASEPRQKYMGRDEHGQPILKALGERKPATVNRMKSTLGAMLTFAGSGEGESTRGRHLAYVGRVAFFIRLDRRPTRIGQ